MPSFFFNDTATTEIYTLSLHDALPILGATDLPRPDAGRHPRLLAGARLVSSHWSGSLGNSLTMRYACPRRGDTGEDVHRCSHSGKRLSRRGLPGAWKCLEAPGTTADD